MQRYLLGLTLASVAALATPARADDAADAKQMLRDWVTAENEHDAAALNRLLDDNFISTFEARTKPTRKAAFIQSLTKGKADPQQTQSLTDETVIVEGDTAILVGTDTFHRTDHAEPDGLALRYTITCVKKNGRWVALAEHIVTLSKKPAQ